MKPKQIQLIYIKPLKTLQIEPKPVRPLNSFLEVLKFKNWAKFGHEEQNFVLKQYLWIL